VVAVTVVLVSHAALVTAVKSIGQNPSLGNLYSQTRNVEAILRLFRVSPNRATSIQSRDAIFPGHVAPVVRKAEDGERELVELSWGFVPPQPGKAPRRVTNTRVDKVQSSFWRDSVRLRRCLVPASSFCEPNGKVKPATWSWFALSDAEEPRPLFAFAQLRARALFYAGIWRRHRGPIKNDSPSVTLDVFSFMTTTPNALVETVNHERMPVLLATENDHEVWLNGSVEEALALVKPPET
jgi:putative SOS response-associated peptidase YedK